MLRKKTVLLPLLLTTTLLASCSKVQASQLGVLYSPKEVVRAYKVSDYAESVYQNFTKIAVGQFFSLYQEDSSSMCLSLPDLFLAYSMMATISDESIQNAFLEDIGCGSIEDLQEISQEVISALCFRSSADKDTSNGSESGAININGFFFDPELVTKEDYEKYLEAFATYYNAYSIKAKPTTETIDKWIRLADTDGYLKDVPVPGLPEDTLFSIVTSYSVIDAFDSETIERLKTIYEEGSRRIDYTMEDGEELKADSLFFNADNVVEFATDYTAVTTEISNTYMKVYYPNDDVSVDTLSTRLFSQENTTFKTYTDVYLNVPMFDVETNIESDPATFMPSFNGYLGTKFFDINAYVKEDLYFILSQNNKLTLDYNGFKGASITVMAMATESAPSEKTTYSMTVDKPFVFSVSLSGLDLYYGKIHNPGYPQV